MLATLGNEFGAELSGGWPVKATHQSRLGQLDVSIAHELVETIPGGANLVRSSLVKGKDCVVARGRADDVLGNLHGLLAAAVKFAFVVAGQSQIEEIVIANGAWRGTRDDPHVVDEEIANRNHLVPEFKDLADA